MIQHPYTLPHSVPSSIFRAYDIRGDAPDLLSPHLAYALGLAIGHEAQRQGFRRLAVGRDGRLTSPDLHDALVWGLREAGCDTISIGLVPSPVLYFATHHLGTQAGVMVTGSHNPSHHNGLKIVLGHQTLTAQQIQHLRHLVERRDLPRAASLGALSTEDVSDAYLDAVTRSVHLERPLSVVLDCGNGATGAIAPRLFKALGCEVQTLYDTIDGRFPNHHPDPSKLANCQDCIAQVRATGADVGLLFDGDGDRLGVVTNDGSMVWPDRQMMAFSDDILNRHPGATFIYDVKCTQHLHPFIVERGGHAIMWKTGHSLIKAKMQAEQADMAGEMSGHLFFNDLGWYGFDDGMYAGARMLKLLAARQEPASTYFASIPNSHNTPELTITCEEGEKFKRIEALRNVLLGEAADTGLLERLSHPNVITIDGLRLEWNDGWALVRASNTTPCLTLRFEGNDADSLQAVQDRLATLCHHVWGEMPRLA